MHKSFNFVTRVPFFRVALIALTLSVMPSFSLNTWNHANNPAAALSGPVGADAAAAQAVGVAPIRPAAPKAAKFSKSDWNEVNLAGLDPKVFELALGAAGCAVKAGVVNVPPTLTVIDYSKPSSTPRFWVFDTKTHKLIFSELVAHGQGSGANVPTMFSNEPETHRTSIGLFVTEDTYVGKNGYSLRLNGLDRGFNDRARERAIVMHGAPYVNPSVVKTQGRLGRSWGCPALSEAVARNVIDTVKGGSLVFSYYPDKNWMESSKYLGDCD